VSVRADIGLHHIVDPMRLSVVLFVFSGLDTGLLLLHGNFAVLLLQRLLPE
jgi:hypothetical protein